MKVKDFKVKLTDSNGNSIILGLDDIFGYEGEVCGTLIKSDTFNAQDSKFAYDVLNYNSGYGYKGVPEEILNCDIEVV